MIGVAGAQLDARLLRGSPRPIAVAYSGGGDSLALLIAAEAWARDAGRPLIALHVDHGLHPEGGAWAQACAERAAALGVGFRTLRWEGAKPETGIEAAARTARHRLIAEAARYSGARVILMGHNASDIAEARAMRAEGGSVPDPRAWSPSPAWPEGRDLFLLRPMLALSRSDIRAWLAARGETWIEDPANADPRFARTRARAALPALRLSPPAPETLPTDLAGAAWLTDDGGLAIARDELRHAGPDLAARFLAFACLCAGGTTRPPGKGRAVGLAERIAGRDAFAATLAGARIEAGAAEVLFLREAGELARGGLQPLEIVAGRTAVWDGRFEIAADRAIELRALAGLAAKLPKAEARLLASLSPAARRALPALVDAGEVRCPLLSPLPGVQVHALAHDRLLAAAGAVDREPR